MTKLVQIEKLLDGPGQKLIALFSKGSSKSESKLHALWAGEYPNRSLVIRQLIAAIYEAEFGTRLAYWKYNTIRRNELETSGKTAANQQLDVPERKALEIPFASKVRNQKKFFLSYYFCFLLLSYHDF